MCHTRFPFNHCHDERTSEQSSGGLNAKNAFCVCSRFHLGLAEYERSRSCRTIAALGDAEDFEILAGQALGILRDRDQKWNWIDKWCEVTKQAVHSMIRVR